ncbi:ARF GAP with effector function(s) [Paramarasmius palmivorus]|uniref:ARF GAP with effector function(S) n=1 Tax=Paramarasmius palmivorus TaxID=297713 RepID=A0AAW0CSV8_9AGAR
MGTHISKVKSVDLDLWTPEQMESIRKWGNRLANLYWEAHLKAGHIPPEHKIESFIRSKYESRRWALEGPPPSNPSALDNGQSAASPAAAAPPAQQTPPPRSTHTPTNSLSSRQPAPPVTTRQSQGHQLLSAGLVNQHHPRAPPPSNPAPAPAAPAPAPPKAPENDLFSLDFHTPTSVSPSPGSNNPTGPAPKKDVKQDILSLFSTPAAAQPAPSAQSGFGQFGQFGGVTQSSPWGAPAQSQSQNATQPTSMMGNNGVGMWGASSGWNAAAPPTQSNVWGAPASSPPVTQQPNLFASSNDIWGGGSTGGQQDPFGSFSAAPAQKKDDVFGDIWGGFK